MIKSILDGKILSVVYPVMEHFYTLQGEGYWAGTPAYFVRLGGCEVGCHWCDVKESWDAKRHPLLSVQEIVQAIRGTAAERVVITGGEPLQHSLDALCYALKHYDYKVHLETSGAFAFSGEFDWVCLSPKKFRAPWASIYPLVNELKVVVYHSSDFEFAERHAALCSADTYCYLQPEWSRQEERLPEIIEYVKAHPRWRISLQTHKFMNIP